MICMLIIHINKTLLIIHTNWGKPEIIHNVDTTRYVATFGCRSILSASSAMSNVEVVKHSHPFDVIFPVVWSTTFAFAFIHILYFVCLFVCLAFSLATLAIRALGQGSFNLSGAYLTHC